MWHYNCLGLDGPADLLPGAFAVSPCDDVGWYLKNRVCKPCHTEKRVTGHSIRMEQAVFPEAIAGHRFSWILLNTGRELK